jgi:hypothetical protein
MRRTGMIARGKKIHQERHISAVTDLANRRWGRQFDAKGVIHTSPGQRPICVNLFR